MKAEAAAKMEVMLTVLPMFLLIITLQDFTKVSES